MVAVPLANLACYCWGTMVTKHYFCKTCGIYTHHHQRRSNPQQYSINIACLAGVNPYSYPNISIGNGNFNTPLPDTDICAT